MAAAKTTQVAKKTDLVEAMMEETGMDRKQCSDAVVAFFGATQKLLKANDRLTITGVGTFNKNVKPAVKGGKKAINPFTKEEYTTSDKPASTKVVFRASKAFMDGF